jgi:phosphoenolpyruvate carboxylase
MLLNVMQARCLKSLRELETTSENGGEREGMKMSELTRLNPKADEYQSALEDSLQISVRGISSGLNNTG